MYRILWEYEVRADQVARFETLYGPAGAWAGLFRGSADFLATELFRDVARPTHFLTVDHWTSRAACEGFLATVHDAYERLDRECAALTERERRMGALEA